MALPGLRDLYNAVEQVASPIAVGITKSPEFARVAAAVTTVNKTLRAEADKVQARAWHALNLPAGTDLLSLKRQVGALDREVRLLSLELERARQQARQAEPTRAAPKKAAPKKATPMRTAEEVGGDGTSRPQHD